MSRREVIGVNIAAWRRMADALGHAPTRAAFLEVCDALDAANARIIEVTSAAEDLNVLAKSQSEEIRVLRREVGMLQHRLRNNEVAVKHAQRAEKAESIAADYRAALDEIRSLAAAGTPGHGSDPEPTEWPFWNIANNALTKHADG